MPTRGALRTALTTLELRAKAELHDQLRRRGSCSSSFDSKKKLKPGRIQCKSGRREHLLGRNLRVRQQHYHSTSLVFHDNSSILVFSSLNSTIKTVDMLSTGSGEEDLNGNELKTCHRAARGHSSSGRGGGRSGRRFQGKGGSSGSTKFAQAQAPSVRKHTTNSCLLHFYSFDYLIFH